MLRKDIFDLSGRVALVTGASSYGIGSVSAKVLAANGAKVFLTARREESLPKWRLKLKEPAVKQLTSLAMFHPKNSARLQSRHASRNSGAWT